MMKIEKVKLISKGKNGNNYDIGDYSLIFRKKGCVGGDHSHDVDEMHIWLTGEIEIESGGEKRLLSAPVKTMIPAGEHHTVWFKKDTIFIERRG